MQGLTRGLVALALMIAASVGAIALKPSARVGSSGPKIELEAMIPAQFGEWREDRRQSLLVVNPQQQELIDKIYAQTLSRTYVNRAGGRVMLSIAYGDNQTGRLRVHRPEVCYSAQGFSIGQVAKDQVSIGARQLKVVRVSASAFERVEPITYWMTVGNTVASSGFEQRMLQLRYGLNGEIPDGFIFRVSSIGSDKASQYGMQDAFIKDLLSNVSDQTRQLLVGAL